MYFTCTPRRPTLQSFPFWNWGGCVWSFFQSSTTLGYCCCPSNSMWTLLQSEDLTSSRQSHFSTQHELHQPENTPNSIIKDYLIPDKNSLEALKASSARKPHKAVTALCERQLNLEMNWGTAPLFHFILIICSLCKRPPSFQLRNKCDEESNNQVNSLLNLHYTGVEFFPQRISWTMYARRGFHLTLLALQHI